MEHILRYEDDLDHIIEELRRQLGSELSGDTVMVNVDIEIEELGVDVNDTVTVDGQEAIIDEVLSADEVEVWLTESEDHKVVDIDDI